MSIVGVMNIALITLSLSALYILYWNRKNMELHNLNNAIIKVQNTRISMLDERIRALEVSQ